MHKTMKNRKAAEPGGIINNIHKDLSKNEMNCMNYVCHLILISQGEYSVNFKLEDERQFQALYKSTHIYNQASDKNKQAKNMEIHLAFMYKRKTDYLKI